MLIFVLVVGGWRCRRNGRAASLQSFRHVDPRMAVDGVGRHVTKAGGTS